MAVVRGSLAWRILPGLVVVAVLSAGSRGTPWLGEWNWTTDWLNGTTLVLAPLAGGCAAFDAVRLIRSRTSDLLYSTPTGERWTVHVWAGNTLVVVALQLLIVAAGLVANLVVGAGGTPDLRSVPTALGTVSAAAAGGVLAAAALRSYLAAPLILCVVFGLSLQAAKGTIPSIFRSGGVTGSMVGLTWDPGQLVGTLVFYVAISAAALLATHLVLRHYRTTRGWAGTAATALVSVVVFGWLAVSPAERLEPHHRPVDYVCTGAEPTVCLATETSRGLDSLARAMGRATEVLRAAGASVPDRWVEVVPGQEWSRDAAPLFIESDVINAPTVQVGAAAQYIATPAYCSRLVTVEEMPAEDYFRARLLLTQWVAQRLGVGDAATLPAGPERTWLELPPAEQAEWVARTYAALSSCDDSAVRLPF